MPRFYASLMRIETEKPSFYLAGSTTAHATVAQITTLYQYQIILARIRGRDAVVPVRELREAAVALDDTTITPNTHWPNWDVKVAPLYSTSTSTGTIIYVLNITQWHRRPPSKQHISVSQKRLSGMISEGSCSHNVLVDNTEHIALFGGTQAGQCQYSKGGTGAAASGLIALNFARVAFSLEEDGLRDLALLQAVLACECAEETFAKCALWFGNLHLEIEDICRIPLFEETLKLTTTTYCHTGVPEFRSLLTKLTNLESSAVAIITCPPHIIACLKLRLATQNAFIIFDSRPYSSYPNGGRMLVSSSTEVIACRLAEFLPTVDSQDSFLQWQAQPLATHITYSIFVSRGVKMSMSTLWQAILESNPAQLSMQSKLSNVRSQIESLNSERSSEGETKNDEARSRQQDRLIHEPESPTGDSKYHSPLMPSRHSSSSTHNSSNPRSSRAPTSPFNREDRTVLPLPQLFNFDDEDPTLSVQHAKPTTSAQRLFECSICMDEMPLDSTARIDSCGHTFCRECLRGHITARLDERRFPILCPTCTANKSKGKGKTGEVSQSLAIDLRLTNEQFSIWTEMEMAAFSIPLHCRKCQKSMSVARDELEEVTVIDCPLPNCNYTWCKLCQQSINFGGPKHSCDGISELDHLVMQQGWKYCPTCRTPIQKESGCNHMTCVTPACNTHFCYGCGRLIVRSGLGQEIKEAVSSHFAETCVLFNVPE